MIPKKNYVSICVNSIMCFFLNPNKSCYSNGYFIFHYYDKILGNQLTENGTNEL